jgi:hypothetical protein
VSEADGRSELEQGLLLIIAGQVGTPLLRLDVPDAMCNCIDWINGGRLVCGTSTGEFVRPNTDLKANKQVSWLCGISSMLCEILV